MPDRLSKAGTEGHRKERDEEARERRLDQAKPCTLRDVAFEFYHIEEANVEVKERVKHDFYAFP